MLYACEHEHSSSSTYYSIERKDAYTYSYNIIFITTIPYRIYYIIISRYIHINLQKCVCGHAYNNNNIIILYKFISEITFCSPTLCIP